MKTTLLLLLTAMSCVAQTNGIIATNYIHPGWVIRDYAQGTNRFTHEATVQGIGGEKIFHIKDFADNNTITVLSTNAVIKCTPGLSPIISKDTNGLWTVKFRKE